jgi:hypothetical protein
MHRRFDKAASGPSSLAFDTPAELANGNLFPYLLLSVGQRWRLVYRHLLGCALWQPLRY